MSTSVKTSLCRRIFNKLFVSNNFYKTFEPILFCSYYYGITSFRVVTNRDGIKSFQTSFFGYINAAFHVIGFGVSYCYTLYHQESIIGHFLRNEISSFGGQMHDLSGLWAATVVFISAVIRRKILLRCMNLFKSIDFRYAQLRVTVNYTVVLRYVIFVLAMVALLDLTICIVCIYCIRALEVHPSPFLVFSFMSEIIGLSISIALYCMLTRSVQRRADLLNQVSSYTKVVKTRKN